MSATALVASMSCSEQDYDRLKDVKQFDESKAGVKGLVDSGISTIPRFFIHPPETLCDIKPVAAAGAAELDGLIIPIIDLSGVDSGRRPEIVEQIARASRELGFFQVVNHGVAVEFLDRVIGGIKGFHEQPTEVKAQFYRREGEAGVAFFSNIDLFHSKAASWRDTLQIKIGPKPLNIQEIPEICRNEIVEWDQQAKRVAELLMESLCEGLGLDAGKLKELSCLEGRVMVAHYYPYCPQPDLTVGTTSHTDPGVLTILLQDHIGGLQVKCDGRWVDVKPVPGALVINIGDILQILSNGECASVEHRVLANHANHPRVSSAIFFNPGKEDSLFGPFPELISPEKPAIYKQFSFADYLKRFLTKELGGKSLTDYYKL